MYMQKSLAVLGLASFFSTAYAMEPENAVVKLSATLTGYASVPSISTNAKGTLKAAINSDRTVVDYTFQYTNLEGGPAGAAHIHLGQTHTNGGVIVFFCGGGTKPACSPAASDTVIGAFTAADVTGPAAQGISPGEFEEFLRALETGNTYAQIHNARFPMGEIRGQIRVPQHKSPFAYGK